MLCITIKLHTKFFWYAIVRIALLHCSSVRIGSAFIDTDGVFGSRGSFFEMDEDFFLGGGSFEANPPFVEATMLAMSLRIEKLLHKAQGPLSFVIFVPGWADTPSFYMMRDSVFNRCPDGQKYLLCAKHDHAYQDGFQHKTTLEHRTALADSFIFFLQNDAGAKKWLITRQVVERIDYEFRREVRSAST